MTPYRDLDAYARAAVELTADRARLETIGAAGRRLYEYCFDWPVVARMVIAALRSECSGTPRAEWRTSLSA
jgi:glycosyltransferase involved in cell wall biosynthesis